VVKFIHWITRFNQWITLTNVLSNPVQVNFIEIKNNGHLTQVSVHVLVVQFVERRRSTRRKPPSCRSTHREPPSYRSTHREQPSRRSTHREPPSCRSTHKEPPSCQMILSNYIKLTICVYRTHNIRDGGYWIM